MHERVQLCQDPQTEFALLRESPGGKKWPFNVEDEWTRKRTGILLVFESEREHKICSFVWADNFWIMSHSKENLELMLRNLIKEASRRDLLPKLASLWWASTYDSEEKLDMTLGTTAGATSSPSKRTSRSWAVQCTDN